MYRTTDGLVPGKAAAGLPLIVVGPRMVENEVSNSPGVEAIAVVDDPSVPGVIDDIVDELVELTMLAGGEVVFVDGGELGDDRVVGVRRGPGQPADVERFRISA